MADECRHVRVTGTVQGVAFRAWTDAKARALGLRGWVQNENDGSVTALICGRREAVEEMLTAFWQGPGAAEVRDVQAEKSDAAAPEAFSIRR